jgi:hypothetical protein
MLALQNFQSFTTLSPCYAFSLCQLDSLSFLSNIFTSLLTSLCQLSSLQVLFIFYHSLLPNLISPAMDPESYCPDDTPLRAVTPIVMIDLPLQLLPYPSTIAPPPTQTHHLTSPPHPASCFSKPFDHERNE